MGLLADAYAWVDKNVAGGFLPGGAEIGSGLPGVALGQSIGAGAVSLLTGAPQAAAPAGTTIVQTAAGPVAVAAPGGIFGGGGAAMQAAAGMPVVAPRGVTAPRGRTITATASVYPDGTIIPRRMVPGRSLVTTEDLRTIKRVKKVSRALARAFPKPAKRKQRRLSAPRTKTVYVQASAKAK